MSIFFISVLLVVIVQRLLELWLAHRNAAFIRSRGGYEIGADHYKYLVGLHVMFFASLAAEVSLADRPLADWWWAPFSLFAAAQLLRYWCIRSLGPFWNTRIFILPGAKRVTRGPYRYLRHPNYLVVGIELLALPLTFSAYYTAALFTLANCWLLLAVRIPLEEDGLS
ncbi:isoprenylcysteine carboxyl methyltransferase family protein [Brevibacillus massiliensis]|uniref:isoprenylcysteine carboxyl methyltransferase family protein n=1 Tax=Brevibacillus massiliensis TaxID=1118054 RepID=UPI0002DD9FB2|nr:isoprenylcysteine carboxylmethyltransferase family protein [Brevibacillus massiliensis]